MAWIAGVALVAALWAQPAAAAERVLVFAAASLKGALDAAVATAPGAAEVVISYAGTPALARQIQHGAPADVFIAANAAWMDALQAEGLVDPASRRALLGNRLALVAAAGAAPRPIDAGLDLEDLLGQGRLAMALVDAVPAGLYGRTALRRLGLWAAAAPRVAQLDNVRAALALVAAGAAPAGVVYATDAAAEPRVALVGLFPADSHPPILYPAAVAAGAGPAARALLDHLGGPAAQAVFAAHGFTPPPDDRGP